jgi:hypothetical protein
MPTSASITIVKMIESLPEPLQDLALEHMQEYLADIKDELKWNESFKNSRSKLVEAARQARDEIAQNRATPMDLRNL